MTETVKIKVDGRELEAPKGKLLIEVCLENGIDIPNFCYYPDLTPQAACRMCLVRIERMPKLATSCTVQVQDGMVVTTQSEEVLEARKGMLDLILGNHPLDCPICDKGGQCELQDQVFAHGTVYGRYEVKKNDTREWRLSPFIAYDPQRCVRCYRCIRVCDEVMDVHALGRIFRGAKEVIGPYGIDKGYSLDCEQCGYCVEVCPVGALLSVDSRFRSRPWDMRETITTCQHCADGCQMRLGTRGSQYVRVASKDLKGINGEFLCIKGRYGSSYISSEERLDNPYLRKDGKLVEVGWEEAIKYVAARLKAISAEDRDAVAVLGSPRLTNEAAFALASFARKGLKTSNYGQIADVDLTRFFANLTAPLATHAEVKKAETIFMLGGDPTENNPLSAMVIRYAVRKNGARLLMVNSRRTKIARRQAEMFLHIRRGAEPAVLAALIDSDENAARYAELAKVKPEQLRRLGKAISDSKRLLVVIGPEVNGATLEVAARFAALLKSDSREVKYLILPPYNNSVGTLDMGLRPNGHELKSLFGTKIKALYLAGSNPVEQYGNSWKEALSKLDLLVVADLFMTETAQLADVVFPVNSFAELDGTYTNAVGQVQRVNRALEGTGRTRPDWMIINMLAKEMGLEFGARGSAASIFRDIASEIPAYSGISYDRLRKEWAIQTERKISTTAEQPDALLSALKGEIAKIDLSLDLDREPVRQGSGLFRLGTLTSRVAVMREAFKAKEQVEEATGVR
ncbi:MAG: molybdopterin-dependent oxidoreductase [Acidobacteriota bacterium]|nr:molybdopterin-dependent oxidoreductase [Blastocatellia bacterium]MDW8412764.1 molybdopterin-dependent oxidoreductase [Acidobacteriota bacterium]